MKRLLYLVILLVILALGCAVLTHQGEKDQRQTATQALIKSWADVWIDQYTATGQWPSVHTGAGSDSSVEHRLTEYGPSLAGRGGNLATTDSWGTQLKGLIYYFANPDGALETTLIIASPGPDRRFGSDLREAVGSSQCYDDDIFYRAVYTSDVGQPSVAAFLPTKSKPLTTPAKDDGKLKPIK